jgi:hypothetical protein
MTRGRINATDGYVDYTAGKLSVLGSGTNTNANFMNTSKMFDNGFCSGMVQTADGGIMGAGGHSAVSLHCLPLADSIVPSAFWCPTIGVFLHGAHLRRPSLPRAKSP